MMRLDRRIQVIWWVFVFKCFEHWPKTFVYFQFRKCRYLFSGYPKKNISKNVDTFTEMNWFDFLSMKFRQIKWGVGHNSIQCHVKQNFLLIFEKDVFHVQMGFALHEVGCNAYTSVDVTAHDWVYCYYCKLYQYTHVWCVCVAVTSFRSIWSLYTDTQFYLSLTSECVY